MKQSKATIIAATITAIASIIVGLITLSNEILLKETESTTRDNEICQKIKDSIGKDIMKIEFKMEAITNDEEKFTFLYWKKSLEEINKYDCNQVNKNYDKINSTIKQAVKETGI